MDAFLLPVGRPFWFAKAHPNERGVWVCVAFEVGDGRTWVGERYCDVLMGCLWNRTKMMRVIEHMTNELKAGLELHGVV